MQIYVVGASRTTEMLEFQRFALHCGCDLRMAHPEGAPPDFDSRTSGVVVFEDASSSAINWVERVRYQARYLSIPIVAITLPQSEHKVRLMSAGASAVFESNSPFTKVLAELSAARAAEPVVDERYIALVEPFNTSTITTFSEMAQLNVRVRSIYQHKSHKMFGDFSAVIGLISSVEGAMVISFSHSTAVEVARRVLMGVADEINDDMLRDCIGEVANVIAGHARGKLAETPHSFAMSTPTVISGVGHQIRHKSGAPCLVSAFTSDAGDFALQVCLGA